ncbi:MAG: DUF2442 domain-containing protein [Acidobacteria bacterium]|nr:DUF2442 domain-containing protein [Acidobacteriota bacterium]MBI3427994.1 DUF2442 domain-containing protein [Acidobacteriota bacterium]
MATHKAGKWTYTDEEFEVMFAEADRRGKEAMKTEITARHAYYDPTTHRLVIELKNGATHSVPCQLIQGLRDADPADIAAVELGLRGASLHWEKLDNDFTVGGLVRSIYGTKKWMERLARENEEAVQAKTAPKRPRVPAAATVTGKRRRKAA